MIPNRGPTALEAQATAEADAIPRLYVDEAERDWLTLFPEGRFYAALPLHGLLQPFDYSAASKRNPDWCGTYTILPRQIHLQWGPEHGSVRKILRRQDDNLEGRDNAFTAVLPDDGLRLKGEYVIKWKGEYGSQPRIRFTPDGQFVERDLLAEIGWEELDENPCGVGLPPSGSGAEPTGSPTRGEGLYIIARNTLELRYADGRVARISFYALPHDRTPDGPRVFHLNSFDLSLVS